MDWMEELEDLEEADEFLDFFSIAYEMDRVAAVRLPLLARFRQNLEKMGIESLKGLSPEMLYYKYKDALIESAAHFAVPGNRPDFSMQSSCGGCSTGCATPNIPDFSDKFDTSTPTV